MNMKNTVKKIAAIAGSATMLGATMFGAMAAADLSTITDKTGASEFYTTDGEMNAFVVVGSGAAVSDVAGAIDLAAAFAQKATLGGEGGGALIAKNVTPGYLETAGGVDESVTLGGSADVATFTATTTGFDWLLNDTIVYNDTSYFIEETITTSALNSLTDQAAFYWWSEGGVKYNISANTTLPLNFDSFPLAGSTYEIVAFDNVAGTLELGQLQPVTGVNIGETVPIGTGGINVKLDDIRQTQTAWKAVLTIYNAAGGVAATNIQKAAGEKYENDTLGISVTVDNLYRDANDVWNVDFQWTESSVKLKNNNLTTTIYPGYKSKIGLVAGGVNWLAFETPGGAFEQFPSATFSAGNTYDLFGGYFDVIYEKLRIGGDTSVDEGEETSIQLQEQMLGTYSSVTPELIFYNAEGKQVSIDIFEYKNVPAAGSGFSSVVRPTSEATYAFRYYNAGTAANMIEIWDVTSGQAFLQNITNTTVYGDYLWTNKTSAGTFQLWMNASGATLIDAKFNITLKSFTSNATFAYDNLTYTYAANSKGYVTLTEPDAKVIKYTYNDTNLEIDGTELAEGSSKYSSWGTKVSYISNVMEFKFPEYQRIGKIAVGRTTEQTDTVPIGGEIGDSGWVLKSGGGESPVWIFTGPTDQGISKLDTEYTNNAPVVLVGGPNANTLVKDLQDSGAALVDANDTALIPAADHAYVELVEDAFGTYDALIVAGYGAADTRMAAKVIASQILHGTPLGSDFTGTRLYLKTGGTGVTTIGDVTVETA